MFKGTIRRVVNTVLSPFGVEVRRLQKKISGGEYPNYLKEAQKEGMNVNDWIEQKMGWSKALPSLDQVMFPYLRDDFCCLRTRYWYGLLVTSPCNKAGERGNSSG